MYAHLNVNYLKLDKLPNYKSGWQSIVDVLQQGKFFSSTGEVLIPAFTVKSPNSKQATISFKLKWTFPMNYAEVITGDGNKVYRERIALHNTQSFGEQTFNIPLDVTGKKWVRLEAWDVAANGAFTQTIFLHP
jgi:hypothetical protein